MHCIWFVRAAPQACVPCIRPVPSAQAAFHALLDVLQALPNAQQENQNRGVPQRSSVHSAICYCTRQLQSIPTLFRSTKIEVIPSGDVLCVVHLGSGTFGEADVIYWETVSSAVSHID